MKKKKRQSLIRYVIQGVQQKLKRTFDLNNVTLVATGNTLEYLTSTSGYRADNPDIQYPIAILKPNNLGVDDESYPVGTFAKRAVAKRYGVNTKGDTKAVFNVLPSVLTLEFGYLTDDPFELVEFASMWVFASKSAACNFAIEWLGVKMDVRVSLDPNMPIPEFEATPDTQRQAVALGTITVHCYVNGPVEDVANQSLTFRPDMTFSLLEPQ